MTYDHGNQDQEAEFNTLIDQLKKQPSDQETHLILDRIRELQFKITYPIATKDGYTKGINDMMPQL